MTVINGFPFLIAFLCCWCCCSWGASAVEYSASALLVVDVDTIVAAAVDVLILLAGMTKQFADANRETSRSRGLEYYMLIEEECIWMNCEWMKEWIDWLIDWWIEIARRRKKEVRVICDGYHAPRKPAKEPWFLHQNAKNTACARELPDFYSRLVPKRHFPYRWELTLSFKCLSLCLKYLNFVFVLQWYLCVCLKINNQWCHSFI